MGQKKKKKNVKNVKPLLIDQAEIHNNESNNHKNFTNLKNNNERVNTKNSLSFDEDDANIRWKIIRERLKESLKEPDSFTGNMFVEDSAVEKEFAKENIIHHTKASKTFPIIEEDGKHRQKSKKTEEQLQKKIDEPIIEVIYEENSNALSAERLVSSVVNEIEAADIKDEDRFSNIKEEKSKKKSFKNRKSKGAEEKNQSQSDKNISYKDAEEDNLIPMEENKKGGRRIIILGSVLMFFALIGIIFTLYTGIRASLNLFSDDTRKTQIARFLTPVVLIDPPPFESPSKLDNTTIISAAIWDLIIHEDVSKYSYSDSTAHIPITDVEVHVKKLFGDDLEIQHQIVAADGYRFVYIEEEKVYEVSKSLRFVTYQPQIIDIQEDQGIYTLKVSYYADGLSWGTFYTDEQGDLPVKSMTYILQATDNDSYTILSVKLDETAQSVLVSSNILPFGNENLQVKPTI